MPPWCESILGLKVEAMQGKQVSLEWTEISGGLWEWWHDTGVPLTFPVESNPQVPAPTKHMVLGPGIEGRGSEEATEQLASGLAFPEATRVGP